MKKGFTLVEIMIVVAILGLLIAIGVPGFLQARNRAREKVCKTNLKAIADNIASYNINLNYTFSAVGNTILLWPATAIINDANSYIRKQLHCPSVQTGLVGSNYAIDTANQKGSCVTHGTEDAWH